MNYLFYGTDSGKIRKAIDQLVKEERQRVECDVMQIDMQTTPFPYVMEEILTQPFFADQKILILRNPLFLSGKMDIDTQPLEKYLERPSLDTMIIFWLDAEKLDSRKKVVKTIQTTCRVKNFQPVTIKDKKLVVLESLKEHKLTLNRDLIDVICDRVLLDSGAIDHEIEKLAIYPEELTQEVIEKLIIKPLDEDVFQLSNAILKGNFKKAMHLYRDMIQLSNDPIYLIAVLASQFRFYYQVKVCMMKGMNDAECATYLKAHPYRVKVTMNDLRGISAKGLLNMLNILSECDQKIKNGKIDKYIGFEWLLIQSREVLK